MSFEMTRAGDKTLVATEAGTMSAVVRAESEIQSAIISAKRFPRNEDESYSLIMRACGRPSFAEASMYMFPRGKTNIIGPSVDLAREIARCWTNVRSGIQVITIDESTVHIKGFALDVERNVHTESEDKFARLIQRTGKGWIAPDERDLRELINRRGAICERNAILKLIPAYVIEDAMAAARSTIQKCAVVDEADDSDHPQEPKADITNIVTRFERLGVTPAMLIAYLKHPLDRTTKSEAVELMAIGKSIADGNSKAFEYFGGAPTEALAVTKTDQLNELLSKQPKKESVSMENGGAWPVVSDLPDTNGDMQFELEE